MTRSDLVPRPCHRTDAARVPVNKRVDNVAEQIAADNRKRLLAMLDSSKQAAEGVRPHGFTSQGPAVIELSRRQFNFNDGFIAEQAESLYEDWIRHVDEVLQDAALLDVAYQALARRWEHSRGRPGTPVEVVIRLLVLKHLRNWSYAVLEREVRANLVYRQFTRIGAGTVPDANTLGRVAVETDIHYPSDAARPPAGRYPPVTAIRRGCACACFGMRRVRTPSLRLASMRVVSSSLLSVKLRR